MGTDADFIAHLHDQAGLGARLTHRRMFGEYALYLDGKVVGFACDNQLFVKPTEAGRSLLGQVDEAPPYPGAKNYFRLGDELDDRSLLQRCLQVTADALPLPKPKPKPKGQVKAGAHSKGEAELSPRQKASTAKRNVRTKVKSPA